MKIQILKDQQGKESLALFYCPACREIHPYNINHTNPSRNWSFNNDFEKPSFSPSLRVLDGRGQTLCHLYVKEGRIEYCSDCPHHLHGQTIDLPDIPEELQYET